MDARRGAGSSLPHKSGMLNFSRCYWVDPSRVLVSDPGHWLSHWAPAQRWRECEQAQDNVCPLLSELVTREWGTALRWPCSGTTSVEEPCAGPQLGAYPQLLHWGNECVPQPGGKGALRTLLHVWGRSCLITQYVSPWNSTVVIIVTTMGVHQRDILSLLNCFSGCSKALKNKRKKKKRESNCFQTINNLWVSGLVMCYLILMLFITCSNLSSLF